jgi:hypothetical protein
METTVTTVKSGMPPVNTVKVNGYSVQARIDGTVFSKVIATGFKTRADADARMGELMKEYPDCIFGILLPPAKAVSYADRQADFAGAEYFKSLGVCWH